MSMPVSAPQSAASIFVDCLTFFFAILDVDPDKKVVVLKDRQSNQRFVSLAFSCYMKLCRTFNRLSTAEVSPDGEDEVVLGERFHRYGDRFYYLTLQRFRNKIYLYLKLYSTEADVRKSEVTPLATLRFDLISDKPDIILPKIMQVSPDLYNPEDGDLPPPLPLEDVEKMLQPPPPPPSQGNEAPYKIGPGQLQRTTSFQLASPMPRGVAPPSQQPS